MQVESDDFPASARACLGRARQHTRAAGHVEDAIARAIAAASATIGAKAPVMEATNSAS